MPFNHISRMLLPQIIQKFCDFQMIFPDNFPVIHNLANTDHIFFTKQMLHRLKINHTAGGFQFFTGRWNAARNPVENINRCIFCRRYHLKDSANPFDICHLMWFGNHCGDTIFRCTVSKRARRCHRTFNVHMDIHHTWNHVFPICIDCMFRIKQIFVLSVNIVEFSIFYRDICIDKFFQIRIKYFRMFYQQLNLLHLFSPHLYNRIKI